MLAVVEFGWLFIIFNTIMGSNIVVINQNKVSHPPMPFSSFCPSVRVSRFPLCAPAIYCPTVPTAVPKALPD